MTDVYTAVRSPNASAQKISALILKDFALTNAILKTVNSAFYTLGTNQRVSTISRAVLLLGVDTLANLAIGLNIFEHFNHRADVKDLKKMTVHTLLTGVNARELVMNVPAVSSEEAFICGMMFDLGHMVVTFYFPEVYAQIEKLIRDEKLSGEVACKRALGISYREVGQAVAKSWQFPDDLCNALRGMDDGKAPDKPTPEQKLKAAVSYASDLATIATVENPEERVELLKNIRERYKAYIPLNEKQLEQVMVASTNRLGDLTGALRITRKDLEAHAPALFKIPVMPARPVSPISLAPLAGNMAGAKPKEPSAATAAVGGSSSAMPAIKVAGPSPELIVQALDEIAEALTTDFKLNDVLMMILEAIYRGIGVEHVILSLITPQRDLLVGRFGLGSRTEEILPKFSIRLDRSSGPLGLVISGPKEVLIMDTSDPRQIAGVPADFLKLLQIKSFIFMPIVIQNKPIGAFYIDRSSEHGAFSESDQRNLRLLRNHAVLAIRQSRTG